MRWWRSSVGRRTSAGAPATNECGGISTPSSTTAPAATIEYSPTLASPLTTAPLPIRQCVSTVLAWQMTWWPSVT